MTDVLINERHGTTRTLTLNRPSRRNALSAELVRALREAIEGARDDDETGVIVLTGAGDKAFCSGGDLDPALAAEGPWAMHRNRLEFVALLRAFRSAGKPIICKLNGPVLAGGVGLLASADLAVAPDDVYVSTPELKRGLFPMMIMAIIARNVGQKHAMELLLTGDRFSAEDAHRMGLLNRVCKRKDLDDVTEALAEQVGQYSRAVTQLGRDAYYAMQDMPVESALEFLCGQLSINTTLGDATEGIMAFMQKRDPEWTHK